MAWSCSAPKLTWFGQRNSDRLTVARCRTDPIDCLIARSGRAESFRQLLPSFSLSGYVRFSISLPEISLSGYHPHVGSQPVLALLFEAVVQSFQTTAPMLNFRSLCEKQRVFNVDTEITNRVFDLGMTE